MDYLAAMPPRAKYGVRLVNDMMVILQDGGGVVSVIEDADSVLEHLSLTLPRRLTRQRVYVEEHGERGKFHELCHRHGDLESVTPCSIAQGSQLQDMLSVTPGAARG
jgi:hypothetical protein